MARARWHKSLRDLAKDPVRSVLVALAIATGVFGVSFILDAYAILDREIGLNYARAKPRSATIWMEKVDGNAEALARAFPGVSEAEASRGPVRARVRVGPDKWLVMQLQLVADFGQLRVDRFFPQEGAWPPADDEILAERATLPVLGAELGDEVLVRVMSAPAAAKVRVSGTVFDPNQDPAWASDTAVGYVTPGGLARLGGQPPEQGLRIVAAGPRARVLATARSLASSLAGSGYSVRRIEVPIPGKYPQSDKVDSILSTLGGFGLLCLALSCVLTAVLVSSLVKSQVRQIGVMKAIGASRTQIASIYLVAILALAVAALAVGVPLGALAARSFSLSTLRLLNFEVAGGTVPAWAVLAECAIGLVAPLVAAMGPLSRGARITVREALADEARTARAGGGRIAAWLGRNRRLPRILSISLRNSARDRGRLALQLGMLALGGAAFISSLDSAASWNRAIDTELAGLRYDADIRLGKPYPKEGIERVLRAAPGIAAAEARAYTMASAFPRFSDGSYGGPYPMFGIQSGSRLVEPRLVEGRWYASGARDEIVIDTDLVDEAERRGVPIKVGETLPINLGGADREWKVVGVVDKQGLQSAGYASYEALSTALGQEGLAMSAVIVAEGRGKEAQAGAVRAAERALADAGMSVFVIQDLGTTRRVMVNHVALILGLLVAMSALIAAVGVMALASTMGSSVAERSREFGVMRAVGARRRSIMASVLLEGAIVGALSWAVACLISFPLTAAISAGTGQFIFPRIMRAVYQPSSFALWLALALVAGAIAAWYPARKAAGLTVRESLSYE